MATNLAQIDPHWAWSPFQPTAERPFDIAAAAHLYRRAGFAANRRQLEQAVTHPHKMDKEVTRFNPTTSDNKIRYSNFFEVNLSFFSHSSNDNPVY